MNWGGVIAGALGQAGGAVAEMGRNELDQQRRQELMRAQAEIEKDKLAYQQSLAKDLKMWEVDQTPGGFADQARKGKVADATAVGQAETGLAVDRAKQLIPVAVQQEREVGGARAENEGKAAGARLSAETAEMLKRFNDPNYFKGVSAEARAKHIESQASLAQAALAKLQMEGVQDTQRLQRALADANRIEDPTARDAARAKIQQEITDRAFTGKDTKGAYTAYVTASTKLIDLQAKVNDDSKPLADGEKARLNAEIAETRAVLGQAARDLGVKTPDAKPSAPYPDGTEVRGPDGKAYVVKDGVPVPKGSANSAGAPASSSTAKPLLSPEEQAAADKIAADRKKKEEWDAEVKNRDKAERAQLKAEVSGLSVDQIRALTSDRALEFLSKYSAVLTPEQRRALNGQVNQRPNVGRMGVPY